jgi:hypothetical protein
MQVGGEGWEFDIEARLAGEPPSSFAQAGGPAINERRDRPELGGRLSDSAQDFRRLNSAKHRRKEAVDNQMRQSVHQAPCRHGGMVLVKWSLVQVDGPA